MRLSLHLSSTHPRQHCTALDLSLSTTALVGRSSCMQRKSLSNIVTYRRDTCLYVHKSCTTFKRLAHRALPETLLSFQHLSSLHQACAYFSAVVYTVDWQARMTRYRYQALVGHVSLVCREVEQLQETHFTSGLARRSKAFSGLAGTSCTLLPQWPRRLPQHLSAR